MLTLARVPLGVLFVAVAGDTRAELAVLAAAAMSDVLDGVLARRHRRLAGAVPADGPDPQHHGDWLDPLCDKLFVGTAVTGIWLAHRPPPVWLLLAITREITQVAGMAAARLVPALRPRAYRFRAHALGKATTVAQFLAMGAFVVEHGAAPALAAIAAALGIGAVGVYARRAWKPT